MGSEKVLMIVKLIVGGRFNTTNEHLQNLCTIFGTRTCNVRECFGDYYSCVFFKKLPMNFFFRTVVLKAG